MSFDRGAKLVLLHGARSSFIAVFIFSCALNILMLTGPLFMMQIYDRVLTSQSIPTLGVLFGIVIGLYLFLGLFDYLRMRILSRTGYGLEARLMQPLKSIWLADSLTGRVNRSKPLADLSTLRMFVSSSGPPALFDLPWVPFYLLVVYLLHPFLGYLALAGAIIVVFITIITEILTTGPVAKAAQWDLLDQSFSEKSHRSAQSIISMGMMASVSSYWRMLREEALIRHQRASTVTELSTASVKFFRMTLQSGILALGAYLAIHQDISAGSMIAASILSGKALAPIDMAVGNWKSFVKTRQAYKRLSELLNTEVRKCDILELPNPKGKLEVKSVEKYPPCSDAAKSKPILDSVTFSLNPGDGLGVLGPSASGKSSLARLLVGLWMPDSGEVRLDGATLDQWDPVKLGSRIGYLPQSIELLPGTIRQNISRFDPQAPDELVIKAAQLAGVHDMILNLPKGYETVIDEFGTALSGGQIQRVALARAIFGNPVLVVLDEPNSNLDPEGDMALARTIEHLRSSGSTVVVMAHRPSAISKVNKVLILENGRRMAFGDKDQVLQKPPTVVSSSRISPNSESEYRKAKCRISEHESLTSVPRKIAPDSDSAGIA